MVVADKILTMEDLVAKYFLTEFALLGNVTAVPQSATDGTVNYTDGFGGDYGLPIGTGLLGKPVTRNEINQLFKDVTGAIKYLQENGFMDWQSTNTEGYTIGATVLYNNAIWTNTVANNVNLPSVTNGWQLIVNKAYVDLQVGTEATTRANADTTLQNNINANALGVGQTWQFPLRALGVTYTNSTSRPIEIMVYCNTTGVNQFVMYASINSGAGITIAATANSSGGNYLVGSMIIPSGNTYNITSTAGLIVWAELR